MTRYRSDGIRTIEDIRLRCKIDEDIGCWIWAGANSNGLPCTWFPPLRKTTSLGVAICYIRTGKPPPRGTCWHSVCGNKACVNPKHRKAGNRSSQMLAAGLKRCALVRAKISRGKRVLTDQQISEIRASHGQPLKELAVRFGITPNYVSEIRSGYARGGSQYGTIFAGLIP